MISYNERQLRRAGRNIQLPFSLLLDGSEKILRCDRILRVVPGKRSVLLGSWGDIQVVSKLFYHPLRGSRNLKRDAEGTRALLDAGIDTARILYEGKATHTKIDVSVFEYIHHANSLEVFWNTLESEEEKKEVLSRFMHIIAKMHMAGLRQLDLHLDNFLIKDRIIYLIDGSSIKQNGSKTPLGRPDSLDNLALLFAQLKAKDAALAFEAYPQYLRARGWEDYGDMTKELELRIEQQQRHRIKKYRKKVLRESTDIVRRATPTRLTLCKRKLYTPNMKSFLDNPDNILDYNKDSWMKNGNTSTVVRVKIDSHDLVVKRYNIKGARHWLRRSFRSTRAIRSWKNAHHLLMLGIATSRPLVVLERRFGPFRGKAYFISEYVEGPHAKEFFGNGDLKNKHTVARKIVDLLKSLESAKISHGDMKATNIILHNQSPVLIDLDCMQVHESTGRFISAHRKDMKRFFKNWEMFPEAYDLFRELAAEKIKCDINIG